MANSFAASRIQLIYALCLPLAVLLGYFLADPLDPGSVFVVATALGLLSIPILMRWHQPILLFSWNAAFAPYFVPGQPFLWMLLAFIGLSFGLVSRFTNPDAKFVWVPEISKPLIFLVGVVALTAWLRGGIGLRSLGSERYGGKAFFYVLASVAGYFALTSRRLDPERTRAYTAIFFLSGLTALIPNLAYLGGRTFDFLFYFFPPLYASEQALGDYLLNSQLTRMYGVGLASIAFSCWVLARYGVSEAFRWDKPWRWLLLFSGLLTCCFSGFRSELILLTLLLAILIVLEGLSRPRMLISAAAFVLIALAVLVPNVQRLPPLVQRTISFLPVEVSPGVRMSVEGSSQWRLELWRRVLPDVPRYLLLGKGYGIDPTEVSFAIESARRGYDINLGPSLASGEYHNGLLTLIVPLGIWGLIGFGWFVIFAVRYLYRNFRDSTSELKTINTFLFAFFVARLLVFLLVFGSFYSEFFYFTGALGLSVSLNGPKASELAEGEPEEESAEVALGLGKPNYEG